MVLDHQAATTADYLSTDLIVLPERGATFVARFRMTYGAACLRRPRRRLETVVARPLVPLGRLLIGDLPLLVDFLHLTTPG